MSDQPTKTESTKEITYICTPESDSKKASPAPPKPASKKYTWQCDGQVIDYTVTAETLPIYDGDNKFIGNMFMLSYVTDEADKSDRPVTFLWNGGPGGASYMVNIGGVGPKHVKLEGFKHIPTPGDYEDNPYTLLTDSDLIYIDAFGTGYSHVDPNYDSKKVWGVDGDADAFTRGIIAWLQKHDRFNAPLYIYGESYGTMRNAVVYRMLGEQGIGVTGVIEQSSILDYAPTLSGNDDYYLGMLPVYAATAQFFGKAGEGVDPEEWFEQAMHFSDTEYAMAITQAANYPADQMQATAEKMSKFIGMPTEWIMSKNLRIELDTFRKALLADKGETLGRYDMRLTTYVYPDVQGDNEFYAGEDPSYDAFNSTDTSAYRAFLDEIGYEGSSNYTGLSLTVNMDWNWTHQAPGTMGSDQVPNVAYDMATALRRNPTSRILFFGGRHDAATPFWNVRHCIAKLFLPEELANRIEYHIHSNGHMAYYDKEALSQMAPELKAFYAKRHETDY